MHKHTIEIKREGRLFILIRYTTHRVFSPFYGEIQTKFNKT